MTDEEKKEYISKPWKYTDDVIGSAIVVGYMVKDLFGLSVPDWALAVSLLWLFGSRVRDLLVSWREQQ